jgi:hypothetical protein
MMIAEEKAGRSLQLNQFSAENTIRPHSDSLYFPFTKTPYQSQIGSGRTIIPALLPNPDWDFLGIEPLQLLKRKIFLENSTHLNNLFLSEKLKRELGENFISPLILSMKKLAMNFSDDAQNYALKEGVDLYFVAGTGRNEHTQNFYQGMYRAGSGFLDEAYRRIKVISSREQSQIHLVGKINPQTALKLALSEEERIILQFMRRNFYLHAKKLFQEAHQRVGADSELNTLMTQNITRKENRSMSFVSREMLENNSFVQTLTEIFQIRMLEVAAFDPLRIATPIFSLNNYFAKVLEKGLQFNYKW